jgi:hypothetical protein
MLIDVVIQYCICRATNTCQCCTLRDFLSVIWSTEGSSPAASNLSPPPLSVVFLHNQQLAAIMAGAGRNLVQGQYSQGSSPCPYHGRVKPALIDGMGSVAAGVRPSILNTTILPLRHSRPTLAHSPFCFSLSSWPWCFALGRPRHIGSPASCLRTEAPDGALTSNGVPSTAPSHGCFGRAIA